MGLLVDSAGSADLVLVLCEEAVRPWSDLEPWTLTCLPYQLSLAPLLFLCPDRVAAVPDPEEVMWLSSNLAPAAWP